MKNSMVSIFFIVLLVHYTEAFTCDKTATTCETKLIISQYVTMLHPTESAVFPSDGKLYRYDVTNTSVATPINVSEVIVGDGFQHQKLVVVFNMSMPGPDIIVYEGQRLVVTVVNQLHSEAVTVHWHGLPQRGSPYMDGVPFVTQCPVNPGASFRYDFIARPKGSYWYHSHVGGQRAEGAFGALIIRDNQPSYSLDEHIIQVQEWSHKYSSNLALQQFKTDVINGVKASPQRYFDGSEADLIDVDSALINGKGRYKSNQSNDYNSTPLEVYNVKMGRKYRFRVIGVGSMFPFRVSVDNHKLTIVATDGHDVIPMEYDSFIIYPGERYDFLLNASHTASNYWIRGESIRAHEEHIVAWAILRYDGAPDEEPTSHSQRVPCTSSSKCYILNCPTLYYPLGENSICHDVTKLRLLDGHDSVPDFVQGQSTEYHFALSRFRGLFYIINARHFVHPVVSAISQPNAITAKCDDCIGNGLCHCTHSVTLNHDNTVQMTLFYGHLGSSLGHPMHLHGHSFYVVKMGYAMYNDTTAQYISASEDTECIGFGCMRLKFSNSSWQGDDIPGIQLNNPPRKDTILVPRGGYVVIRIKADNPGLWMMHCHAVLHSLDNFAFLFNESFNHLPRKPEGFPECNNFPPIQESTVPTNYDRTTVSSTKSDESSTSMAKSQNYKETEDNIETRTFWIVVGLLVAIIFVQLLFNFAIHKKITKSSGNKREITYIADIATENGKTNKGYLT